MPDMRKTMVAIGGALALASACRGQTSTEPPVHLVRNMSSQDRFEHQEENEFYADKRAMRPVPAGTVARGSLKAEDAFYRGTTATAPAAASTPATKKGPAPAASQPATPMYVKEFPIAVSYDTVKKGERRFNTYCTPCHGPLGAGGGMVVQRGYPPATNLHDERIRNMPVGEIFNTIGNGIRNMPAYSTQIDEQDRWAIVAYLRALQRSQNAKLEDVPEAQRASLGAPKGSKP